MMETPPRMRGFGKACMSFILGSFAMMPLHAGSVALRGYGEVEAEFEQGRVVFECENEQKADILLGKLLADLFWDAGSSHVAKTVNVDTREVPIHVWPPYGAMAAARVGDDVVVLAADNEEALIAKLGKEKALLKEKARFTPEKPYPLYLDFFDLRAFKSYTHAMWSPRGEGLASHWEFIKKFGMGGIACQTPALWTNSPAPGVVEWTPIDYEMNEARRQGGLVVCCPYIGGEVPLWVHNQSPADMAAASPTSLLGAWGGAGCAGAHYESWGIPLEKRQSSSLAFLRQVMDRFKDNPSLGAWQPYSGEPGAEYGMHERSGEYWDYSPRGQECMRHWLKEVRGLSLKKLGERWHGDSGFYKSWDEVSIPDVQSFFGKLDDSCLRVSDGWSWRKVADGEVTPPASDAAGWVPVGMPPSQQQDFLPWGAAFFRVSFDAGEWAKTTAGKESYLVCAANIRSPKGIFVWLNGQLLGEHKCSAGKGAVGPFGLKVTNLLKEKANELVLLVPSGNSPTSEGKLYGPVFLTAAEPKFYPYLGPQWNARYVDFKEWQAYGISRLHWQMLETVRTVDQERPLILSPGSDVHVMDQAAEMAATFGAGMQMTGREAWYHPWWPGLGHVAGFYGTSEPSATARGKSLSRMLGWLMMDADSNHDLFWTLEDYIKEERENGWFTKNQNVFRLFGKYLRADPKIVILRSVVSMRLGSLAPWSWDIGRGELQSMHFDNVYATERELLKEQVDPYPVLLDAGTEFMDAEVIAAVRRYVEKGGTFIALHNTGRHGTLAPDTWPVSQLTGFKVVSQGKRGKIKFCESAPLFKEWAGREFEGEGSALDWMGSDSAKDVGTGLKPDADGATVLAKWDDGTAALGCRRLGKGMVVVLGSTFWRSGKDSSGAWKTSAELEGAFITRLLGDLGVTRDAVAGSGSVWARKSTSKNGLQDWLIAFNSGDTEVSTDLSLKTTGTPIEVIDLVERKAVPFETAPGGWIRIKNVTMPGMAVKAYGVKRADFTGALTVWWGEKLKYWRKNKFSDVDLDDIGFPTKNTDALAFDEWRFTTDPEGKTGGAAEWTKPDFDDSGWRKLKSGAWNLLDETLKDYSGNGLYRAKFTVPGAWKGHTVALNLYSFNNPIVRGEGEFLINGKTVASYKAHGWSQTYNYDVTSLLVEGENMLSVKVKGDKEFSGICGAVWLAPERRLDPMADLAGTWQVVKGDLVTTEDAAVPGKFTGSHLRKTFDIPADWKGRDIFLHFESAAQWVGSVVVNGRPVSYNSYLHPFGLRTEVNITPFVRCGASNRIELWPFKTIAATGGTGGGSGDKERSEALSAIRVGCEKTH